MKLIKKPIRLQANSYLSFVSWGLGGYLNSYDLSIIDHQERDVFVFAVCYLFLHFYGSREQKSPP